MHVREMFWFMLLEASGVVGFPRPKQMAAGLSCDLPGTETVVWLPCSAHVSPVSEVGRATCELRVGRHRKPWEFQSSKHPAMIIMSSPTQTNGPPLATWQGLSHVPGDCLMFLPHQATGFGMSSRSRLLPGRT